MKTDPPSRRPRVALAAFNTESVSFLPVPSTLQDFERVALRGPAIIEQLRGTNTVAGGVIEVCESRAVQIVPIVHTLLGALGPATDEAVEFYTEEICAALAAQAGQLDGVLLYLHGACAAASYPDVERHIIERARQSVGPDLPIVVALDYHGNVDAATFAQATAAFAYHKSPHIDMGDTGRRAALCLARTIAGEIRPAMAVAKPGVLVPSIFSATSLEPLAGLIAQARAAEAASDRYLDISVMAGFSYADACNTGFSVLCVLDGPPAEAADIARSFARRLHAQRHALYRPLEVYTVDQAMDRVAASPSGTGRPCVLLEHADRMNDSTYVLAAVLARGMRNVAVPFLLDPAAAQAAHAAGAGATITLRLGAHSSPQAGPPLTVTALVERTGPIAYRVTGNYQRGMPVDLGMTALLRVDGVSVSVVSRFAFAVDGDPFYLFGQRPEDFDVIVLRSKTHFRDFYEPIAREILIVDTPDHGPADLTLLDYRRLDRRSVYPFADADTA
ncbi:M81 family metallopeptidase [Bordetella genomosp. 13]|uniref:M81 family metallopeptidase n=1 Tax=Bordetella genomosp. 13 TaxID=463040 RepID=UPI0011A22E9C|nr:M81 family metallopeptidase [Bordetella genomosp. 13]